MYHMGLFLQNRAKLHEDQSWHSHFQILKPNILQYQFMQADIPILVTKSKIKAEHHFRNPSPTLYQKIKNKRNPTAPKIHFQQVPNRHQTLDPEQRASRTRRISSSAASKRFPKDFFRDEACLNPIRSHKPQRKQNDGPSMLDTFSHKNFIAAQGQYLLQDYQENIEDTPKFKEKKINKSQANQRLAQKLLAMKMQDSYIAPKSKYNTCPQHQQKLPLAIMNPLVQNEKNMAAQGFPIVSNFNITLGIKDTLAGLMEKGQRFKKRKEPKEKENNTLPTRTLQNTRRQNVTKVQGFRIRKKFLA